MEGKNVKQRLKLLVFLFVVNSNRSGCPRLTAIDFELKLSIESVNLCEKIPKVFRFKKIIKWNSNFRSWFQYIVSHYQENSDNYRNEYEQINELRQVNFRRSKIKTKFPFLFLERNSIKFRWIECSIPETLLLSTTSIEESISDAFK